MQGMKSYGYGSMSKPQPKKSAKKMINKLRKKVAKKK